MALRAGLVNFDRKHSGWRGPVTHISLTEGDWGVKLTEVPTLDDIDPWRLGVVLQTSKDKAIIGLRPYRFPNGIVDPARATAELPAEGVSWALDSLKAKSKTKTAFGVGDLLAPGDVVYVSPPTELDPPVKAVKETAGGKPPKVETKLIAPP